MIIESPAIAWLRIVAQRLGELRDEVVFLGGATVGLLITDPAAAAVRPTKDVDVIVEVGSWGEYAPLQERLREKGFVEDTEEGAPICRWIIEDIKVDVMPTSEAILGFTNRWYGPALQAAQDVKLTNEISIRLVTAPYFVATKLEAFRGRGQGDYQLSHDLEDLIAVVDGRSEIVAEVDESEADLRDYLRRVMGELLDDAVFREALSGHLPGDAASQQRLPLLVERLEKIAGRGNAKSLDVTKALLSAGEHLPPSLREEILALGKWSIPPLLRIVKEDDLVDVEAPGGGWAPIHAVSILADLRAEEAIEPMLRLLALTDFPDIIHDRLILSLGAMGAPVLEPALEAYADNPDPDLRYSLCGVLSELGVKDARVLRILLDQFDEDILAGAMYLAAYGDPAAIPYLSEVLDEEPVTESPVENQTIIELAEAITHLGGGLTENQWRKQTEAVTIAKRSRKGQRSRGATKKTKLGRNDPCWCGSGRKYKKCHLRSDEQEH